MKRDQYRVVPVRRNRIVYGLLMISTLLLGLGSRYFFGEIAFIKNYVGDVLWALMVYLGIALLFNKWPAKVIALTAIVFSFGIEISQLYHAFWIDSLRATRLGGLILGFSFVWSDLPCYCIGVLIGLLVDLYLIRAVKQGCQKQPIRA